MISGQDIYNWFNTNNFKKPNIMRYSQITDENLDNLINENNGYCCFVLYENSPGVGHWTLLFYDDVDNDISFFDPYGIFMDDQLKFSYYDNKEKELTKLILDESDKNKFEINDFKFQKSGPGINTCGKWCCVRYYVSRKGISQRQFENYFSKIKPIERDIIVNKIYNELI